MLRIVVASAALLTSVAAYAQSNENERKGDVRPSSYSPSKNGNLEHGKAYWKPNGWDKDNQHHSHDDEHGHGYGHHNPASPC